MRRLSFGSIDCVNRLKNINNWRCLTSHYVDLRNLSLFKALVLGGPDQVIRVNANFQASRIGVLWIVKNVLFPNFISHYFFELKLYVL